MLRGRLGSRVEDARAAEARALERLTDEAVFAAARIAFLEMLYAGITCVGEFHFLHHGAGGASGPGPQPLAQGIMRAAHEVGIRLALLNIACTRGDFRGGAAAAPVRFQAAGIDAFIRDTEELRVATAREYPADEIWLGTGVLSLAHAGADAVKALATYARAQRFRFHAHVATTAVEVQACVAEFGRGPVAVLAEQGVVDKRFTAVDGLHLTDDEVKALGTARATVCACPSAAQAAGLGAVAAGRILGAGAGLAFGTDSQAQINLFEDVRLQAYSLRQDAAPAPDPAIALLHAATVTGARSLGATGGALEVGRPADFFTVTLHDPSLAGADAGSLAAGIAGALERRAIRDVWIGGRQRIAGGRHPAHGAIVGAFVDSQKALWSE